MPEMMTASGCVCVWVVCHVSLPNASHGCQQAVMPRHRDKPLYNTVGNVIRFCQIKFPTLQQTAQIIKWQVVRPGSAHSSTHKGERTWHLLYVDVILTKELLDVSYTLKATSHLSWHIFPHTATLFIHINADERIKMYLHVYCYVLKTIYYLHIFYNYVEKNTNK